MKNKVKYQPPEFAQQGLEVDYGFHDSPFGRCLVMAAPGTVENQIVGLAFVQNSQRAALQDMQARWPQAIYVQAPQKTRALAKKIFDAQKPPLLLIGTDFQRQVWKKLLAIPEGQITHYGDLAKALGMPKASRAVGRAVGKNPISWLVPCHRVVRRDGGLGGYHWGLSIKKKMLAFENKEQYQNAA